MRDPATCKLLVVDDEPALSKLLNTYLTRLGYQVDVETDGGRAWERYRAHAAEYDLVIADLTMGDFEVEAVLQRYPELNPSVRVVICSGRPYELAALPAAIRPNFRFVQKPFIPKMLAEAVAEALNAPLRTGRSHACAAV